jgi:hypothetical protein
MSNGLYVKSGNCPQCDFPLDEFGDCTNTDCESNFISENDLKDPFTYEDLEDALDDSEQDEDNEEDEQEEDTVA